VLNAFRHHGVSRSRWGQSHDARPGVLNAFRHHGVSRSGARKQLGGKGSVLNAFRHHGVSRIALPKRVGGSSRCSTPFGITEFRGGTGRQQPGRFAGAQRLSASRSFAADLPGVQTARVQVLNAFRHHGVSRIGCQRGDGHVGQCSTPFGITEFRGAAS